MPIWVGKSGCIDQMRRCVDCAPEKQVIAQFFVHVELLVDGEEPPEEGGTKHCEEAASHRERKHRHYDLHGNVNTLRNGLAWLEGGLEGGLRLYMLCCHSQAFLQKST